MTASVYAILGQTATGKTTRAAELAKQTTGALINCDSRQIYTELDIITGKKDNPADIPIHMVDCASPHEPFSASVYRDHATAAINTLHKANTPAIVVGGTGMYAHFLLHPTQTAVSLTPDIPILRTRYATLSVSELQAQLSEADPEAYKRLSASDKQNPRRLSNALLKTTVHYAPLPATSPILQAPIHSITLLLHASDALRDARIEKRVKERLEASAIDEVRALRAKGYTLTDPGLQTIGYVQVYSYILGELSEREMITQWITKERQYAKRQKTYFLKYFPEAQVQWV